MYPMRFTPSPILQNHKLRGIKLLRRIKFYAPQVLLVLALVGCAKEMPFAEESDTALRFVDELSNKNYEAATKDFTSSLKETFSVAKLEEFWNKMLTKNGHYRETKEFQAADSTIKNSETGEVEDGLVTVELKCQFEFSDTSLFVILKDGQIKHFLDMSS